jgi:DNA-binding beta-propeller fold protein YncE
MINKNTKSPIAHTMAISILALGCQVATSTAQASNKDPIVIQSKYGNGGEIYPSAIALTHGDKATLFVQPEQGFALKHISGCNGRFENQTYVIDKATYSCTVIAEFSSTSTVSALNAEQANSLNTTQNSSVNTSTTPAVRAPSKMVRFVVLADSVVNYVEAVARVDSGQGTVTPTRQKVRKGTTASFTVNPAQGFIVNDISGCGINTVSSGTVVTPALNMACTLIVRFAEQQNNLWDSFNWDNANWG